MTNKAQTEFRTRADTDSRDFQSWYDNEDVQRLIFQIYQHVPAAKKLYFAEPYVFFDNMEASEATTVDKLLAVCHQILRAQNLKFLPFIIKPKMLPHFYAGFIHINPDYIYIFDPVGTTTENRKFRDSFKVSKSDQIGDLPVIVAKEQIQNTCYEKGLVSCGPLCVEFLEYIMNHPEAISPCNFPYSIIPPIFAELMQSGMEAYQRCIVAIRQKHDGYLSQLSDAQLRSDAFEGFNQELTDLLLNPYDEQAIIQDNLSRSKDIIPPYTTQDVQDIIRLMVQNTPPERQQYCTKPCIFDSPTLDLAKELSLCKQIAPKANQNYFPFLFKPQLSPYFCAGLVLNNPSMVYLFIPLGLIPDNVAWHEYLGLSSKYELGGMVLMSSAQPHFRLPTNHGNACTVLSIEFLNYIMQSENAYQKPQQFLELLKVYSSNYQGYIRNTHQKQQGYLAMKPQPTSSQIPNLSAQQIYLQYVSELTKELRRVAQSSLLPHAQRCALSEARVVLNELNAIVPLSSDQKTLRTPELRLSDTELLILAALCSHVTHGVCFMAANQTYQAQIYQGPFGCMRTVHYDLSVHQECMQFINDKAELLPGAGWYGLKKALLILAGALLVACGIVCLATSTPLSSSLLLTLAGTAALSAGIGLFVGRDTGVAAAAKQVTMKPSSALVM